MTRLTNGLSNKWGNLKAALALHFAYYNFCEVHGTIKKTSAMAVGLRSQMDAGGIAGGVIHKIRYLAAGSVL